MLDDIDHGLSFITRDGANLCTPFRPDLATLIPHAREFEHGGRKMLVMPNGVEETRLARNLGVALPPPILTRYAWPGGRKPWAIQKSTAAMLTENKRAYVLSTMGTGKTSSVLYAADYLITSGQARRMLVSCPLSVMSPTWENEIFREFPHLRRRVLHGDRAKRLKLLAQDAEVYIINHHGVMMLWDQLNKKGFDIVVIDELAILRNRTAQLWKTHDKVVEKAAWAWGLTGSPTPMAPTDAWAQVKLLTPERTTKTMGQFQDQTMRKVNNFKWLPRPEANDVVHAQMQPAVRYTLDDVMELPETSFVDRKVDLDPVAAKAYKMLFDKMKMQAGSREITAVNEGVLQSKLLQVACGYIYADDKTVYALPVSQRLAALDEIIDETDRKVIVFVPFVHALEGIADHLKSTSRDVAVIHGAVSRGRRDEIFRGFQHGSSPRVLVAHPQTMAHGLTLTSANTIVWYAPTQSLEIYEQANARIVRPGQTSKTLIAHLMGTAVERATYARLKTRAKMQGSLLALFREQEQEF